MICKKYDLKFTLKRIIDSIDENSDYFATLTGYSTLCRLARDDINHDILEQVFRPTNTINYCSIVIQDENERYVTDVLQEALKSKAIRNAHLIISHLKHSVSTFGIRNGSTLLLKNRSLLAQNNI